MKKFKKRRNIERATLFRVECVHLLCDNEVEYREFASTKSLEQWVSRNDNDNTIGVFVIKREALIDDVWEPYTVIGRKTITLSNLKHIVADLEMKMPNPQK